MLRWPGRASSGSWSAAGKRNLAVMSAVFLIFGLSLIIQPHRWHSTPAYHVLLLILQAQTWGVLFLVSGIGMGLGAWYFERRWLVISSLTAAFMLVLGWTLAFAERYLTSTDTTPVTWVAWSVFAYLLIVVAVTLDQSAPAGPPAGGPEIEDFRRDVDDALIAAAEDQRAVLMRDLAEWSDRSRDAVSAACDAYGQALRAIVPAGAMPASGDLAGLAINEARNALLRAEEAYERATGKPVEPREPG